MTDKQKQKLLDPQPAAARDASKACRTAAPNSPPTRSATNSSRWDWSCKQGAKWALTPTGQEGAGGEFEPAELGRVFGLGIINRETRLSFESWLV